MHPSAACSAEFSVLVFHSHRLLTVSWVCFERHPLILLGPFVLFSKQLYCRILCDFFPAFAIATGVVNLISNLPQVLVYALERPQVEQHEVLAKAHRRWRGPSSTAQLLVEHSLVSFPASQGLHRRTLFSALCYISYGKSGRSSMRVGRRDRGGRFGIARRSRHRASV